VRAIATVLERPIAKGIGATLACALLTSVLAQAAIRLPYTPVPVTFQVVGVLLSGLLLGSRLGALAQMQYLAIGLAGLPVFAGGSFGPAALLGPSGGYLPGFVAGAFVTGLVFERCATRDALHAFWAGMAGVAALYVFGVAWLSVWLTATGAYSPAVSALALGAVPFVCIDAAKAMLAAGLVSGRQMWKR
jgi:biotin transport system substrate-specific component